MSAPAAPPSIDAYGGGGFRIGGERIEGGALVKLLLAFEIPIEQDRRIGGIGRNE